MALGYRFMPPPLEVEAIRERSVGSPPPRAAEAWRLFCIGLPLLLVAPGEGREPSAKRPAVVLGALRWLCLAWRRLCIVESFVRSKCRFP